MVGHRTQHIYVDSWGEAVVNKPEADVLQHVAAAKRLWRGKWPGDEVSMGCLGDEGKSGVCVMARC